MGLLSGIFGGEKTTTPATGMYALPPNLQALIQQLTAQSGEALMPGGQLNTAAFTPIPQTSEETRGIDLVNKGIAPTPQSLSQDLAMLMNPYNEYVENGLNRQATGENSLVNQFGTRAGQQGSNRNFLATSDVEQNRLNNIGQFRQAQYNNAINQILGPLAMNKQQDISNLFGAGSFQRGLDLQTKQAPFNALQGTAGALSGLAGINQGTPETTVKSGGGLGGILKGVSQIAPLFAAPFTGGASLGMLAGSGLAGLGASALGNQLMSFGSSGSSFFPNSGSTVYWN